VHELQVVPDVIPMTAHDVPVDLIVTPERVIRTRRRLRKPSGIHWGDLTESQIRAMPVVAAARSASRTRASRRT
jgi:5-formyltetrahydrofolate cyclo-ligase